jgi:hypothetical protein
MNDLLPTVAVESQAKELDTLSTQELKDAFLESMRVAGTHLIRMAAIVRLLEKRGEDLSDLRYGLLGYIRKIACGQLLPEVVVKFQGAPLLLNRISSLPIPDQEKVVKTETFRVVRILNGDIDVRTVPPMLLSRDEVAQVFAADHIRDEIEQQVYLRARETKPLRRRRAQEVRNASSGPVEVVLDKRRKGLIINGVFFSRADLMKHLAEIG